MLWLLTASLCLVVVAGLRVQGLLRVVASAHRLCRLISAAWSSAADWMPWHAGGMMGQNGVAFGQRISSHDRHNEWKLFVGQVPLEVSFMLVSIADWHLLCSTCLLKLNS